VGERFYVETLGCAKNQVDSEKLSGSMLAAGLERASSLEEADLVVVNTCAFIDAARAESVDTILDVARQRRRGARLVVTGCLAARSGMELATSLPEVDAVIDVGMPVHLPGERWQPRSADVAGIDLLELPRPKPGVPWAYVKVAEGCDRHCGFCAIPSFRGRQRSRKEDAILAEVDALDVQEVVLVAQDLASYGRDLGRPGALIDLVEKVARRVPRVRLFYLYPSSLSDRLIDSVIDTGVEYFDLSLQHVSKPLLRRMRRFGCRETFVERIGRIRSRAPGAALRSSFIVGYPGETEDDHDDLLGFLSESELDWGGFFAFSDEEGTYAHQLDGQVDSDLVLERLSEVSALQDEITARRRRSLVGTEARVLVDTPGVSRSYREAPEIDGVIRINRGVNPGTFVDARIDAAVGADLIATVVHPQIVGENQPMPARQTT